MGESFLSPFVRRFAATFVLITGSVATLFFGLFIQFWALPTAALIAVAGLVWYFRPSVAARLMIAPVLVFTYILLHMPADRAAAIYLVPLASCLFLIGLIVAEFWTTRRVGWIPVSLSVAIVAGSFAVDRLFTNRTSVEVRSMYWSPEKGNSIGFRMGSANEDGIILYEDVPGGTCFERIANRELKIHLSQSGKSIVRVEFNVIRDFGRVRSRNIRSVDGIAFIRDNRVVRDGESGAGSLGAPMVPCP